MFYIWRIQIYHSCKNGQSLWIKVIYLIIIVRISIFSYEFFAFNYEFRITAFFMIYIILNCAVLGKILLLFCISILTAQKKIHPYLFVDQKSLRPGTEILNIFSNNLGITTEYWTNDGKYAETWNRFWLFSRYSKK